MSHRHTAVLRALVLVAAVLPVQALAGEVVVPVSAPVSEIRAEGDHVLATVPLGALDGIVLYGRGEVWDADLEIVGSVEVIALTDDASTVRVTAPAGTEIRLVDLPARVPDHLVDSLVFQAARRAVTFTDNYKEPVNTWRSVLSDPDPDATFLAAGHLAIDETAEFTVDLAFPAITPTTTHDQRWPGGTRVYDGMIATTDDDLLDFLRFVRDFPGKYMGRSWKISETYATWLLNGAPSSPSLLFERWRTASPAEQDAMLRAQADELRAHTYTDTWYWLAKDAGERDRYDEALALAELMHDAAATIGDQRAVAVAVTLRADLLSNQGDDAAAEPEYRRAIELARRGGAKDDEAVAWNNLALTLKDLDRCEEAIPAAEQAIALREGTRVRGVAIAWNTIGDCHAEAERHEAALAARQAALDVARTQTGTGALADLAAAWRSVGRSASSLGRYQEAIDAYRESLRLARELGWEDDVADSLDAVSDGLWNLGEYEQALATELEVAAARERLGQRSELAGTWADRGSLNWNLGRHAEATAAYEQALAQYTELADDANRARVMGLLGDQQRDRGDLQAALAWYDRQLGLLAETDTAGRAEAHWDKAYTQQKLKRFAESDAEYAKALDLAKGVGKSLEADILDGWAQSQLEQKRRDEAFATFERARALRVEVADRAGEAQSLRNLAWWHASRAEYDVARQHADQALAIARAMPSKSDEMLALRILGDIESNAGNLDVALSRYEASLEIAKGTDDTEGIARGEMAIGSVLETRGRAEEGARRYERAIEVARAADRQDLAAEALASLAWVRGVQGRFTEALALAEEARKTLEELGSPWQISNVYNTIASLQHDLGDYGAALAWHERSLAIRRDLDDPWGVSGSLNNIAGVLADAGDCPAAIPKLEEALAIGHRVEYLEVLAVTPGSLARCHAELGHPDEALRYAREGLAVAQKYGLVRRVADGHALLGIVHAERGEHDEARSELQQALSAAEELGLPLTGVTARKWLGIVAWEQGRHAEAQPFLEAAAADAREMRSRSREWEPLFYLGRARRDGGDLEGAIAAYQQAVDVLGQLEQTLGGGARETFQTDNADVYGELVALLNQHGRAEDAFDVLERLKSDEIRKLAKPAEGAARTDEERQVVAEGEELRSRERELERLLREELAKPKRDQRPELIGEWQLALDDVRLRFQDYTRRLEKEQPDLAKRLQVAPAGFFKIQQDLAPNEAFLEPIVLADRVVVFVVRGGDAPLLYRETLVDEASVDALIAGMRDALDRPSVAWEAERGVRATAARGATDPIAPAQGLYDLLIEPVRADLVGVDTLVISPSGRLRYVPFAALHDGDSFLVEDYRVALLTQSGALGEHRPVPKKAPMLAYGNPDGSLPGAESEVETLQRAWKKKGVTAYTRETATKAQLRGSISDYRIVHLATHGVLLPDNPEGSYILLAGEGEDARLTFREIPLLPLDDVTLTVLSACETALGENGEGAEIAGLAYQFEMRGAASVVASLWSVNDASTSELMHVFYDELRRPGTSKADALRAAQLSLLADPDLSHPYHWAPFLLIGDWR